MKHILTAIFVLSSFFATAQSTALERDSLARDYNFQQRVRTITLKTVGDILADTNRQSEWKFAQHIVMNPSGGRWVNIMSYGVLTNPGVNANATDGDIEFTITTIYEKYALAFISAF